MSPVNKPDIADTFRAPMMAAPQTADMRVLAIARLHEMGERGQLQPVEGWDGELVEAYLDILGLNNRPLDSTQKYRY